MKKLIVLLLIIPTVGILAKSSYAQLGIYGSINQALDSVRVNFVAFDTIGKSLVAIDSGWAYRFYNGVQIDSLYHTDGRWDALRTGYYEIAYPASVGYDSTGIYTVFVHIWKNGWQGGLALSYQVAKGGLKSIWDIASYLGACDGCLRILYPLGGGFPKDSGFVIDTSQSPDDTLLKVIFYHGTSNNVMDTMGTDVR